MANKTRGQLVSKLLHMKQGNNTNSIRHLSHKDIDDICEYLLDKHEIENLQYELEETVRYLKQYEEAFNKACEELEILDKETTEQLNKNIHDKFAKNISFGYQSKEEWKELLMRDV